jgi:pimeloyl-ACP methyl ester carboxylesterase
MSGAGMKKSIAAIWDHDLMAVLAEIQSPVVIMPARDKEDPARIEYNAEKERRVSEACRLIRTCKVVWVEDSSHSVTLQHPKPIATALQAHVEAGYFGPDAPG